MKSKKKLISMSFVILVAIIGIWIWWNTPSSIINITPSEVSKIDIFDGTIGKNVTITGVTDIEHIINNLNAASLKKDRISLGYMGYSVRIDIYKNVGEVYKEFIINSSNTIRKDPFFYRDSSDSIDYNYIRELIKKMPDERKPTP